MSSVRNGPTGGPRAEHLARGNGGRPPRATLLRADRLERLRAESAGHLMVTIDAPSQRCSVELDLLDRIGARLASALAGDVGGRITVSITRHGTDVVLELRTARPGAWTRAMQRDGFENLLAHLSSSVMNRGGTLMIGMGPYVRLNVTVRVRACSGKE